MLQSLKCINNRRLKNRNYSSKPLRVIKNLGKVSPSRPVPDHIPRPPYVGRPDFDSADEFGNMPPPQFVDHETLPKMKKSCALARQILNFAGSLVKPGVSTEEIDAKVQQEMVKAGAYPSTLGYMGYPKSICTSINNVLCHGIPSDQLLEDGDIINIDVTVFLDGFHGDCSETFLVGNSVPDNIKLLVVAAREARDSAIAVCGPGKPINIIGKTIAKICRQYGYTSPANLVGHGVGRIFHSEPAVHHWDNNETTIMLPGMTFTIEPILCLGTPNYVTAPDNWTLLSSDNKWNAQFEHTILITETGHEILTL